MQLKRGGDYVSDLRYNRAFKKGLAAILFCIILFSSIVVFFIVFKIQYDQLTSGMKPLEATIVDVDSHVRRKGLNWQEIYIEYAVDGIVYNRELKTDTAISFRAGTGAHYSVGEKVPIFYNPQNPEIIASPRSVSVGIFWLIFALFFLGLVLFSLWWMIKSRQKFLVTQEEYDKEGEELKKSKLAKKQQKKQDKFERKKNNVKTRKILKFILISIVALIGAFLLFHFFRGFIGGLTS
jgi:cell division protein FtsB